MNGRIAGALGSQQLRSRPLPRSGRQFYRHSVELYRNLYACCARRCAADWRRRADLVRAGVVCRNWRIRDGLVGDGGGRVALAGDDVRTFADRLVATLLGAVTLRLSGHYLPLSTIAWGLAIYYQLGNIEALGGYNGISGIPPISIASISLSSNVAIFYLIWATAAAARLSLQTCSTRVKAAGSAASGAAS